MTREASSDILEIVSERYPIVGELGRGGMSVVYEARDPRINRAVAIKILHPHLAQRAETNQRFLQEAMAIARLENPNILKVYDYASPEGSVSYIVSEIVRGMTLKSWVEEHPIKHWEVAALLALPLFKALKHVHQQEIIHRDVKPENIMIRAENGAPVLMDFGIAHIVDADTLTATGAVLGSPAYMAPEVVNGEELTTSVDLFSMGTVLYWMTCGLLPFVAPNPAALFRRILEARFDPILTRRPEVLGSFARLIERCLSREPQQRPPDAGAIADQIEKLLSYAGLTEIDASLCELVRDPEEFQRHLPERLAPHYCESALDALQRGELGLANELIERALALEPELERAQEIAQRLARARGSWLQLFTELPVQRLVSLFVGIALVSFGWLIYGSISVPLEASSIKSLTRVEEGVSSLESGSSALGVPNIKTAQVRPKSLSAGRVHNLSDEGDVDDTERSAVNISRVMNERVKAKLAQRGVKSGVKPRVKPRVKSGVKSTRLKRADLKRADLKRADLKRADLKRADLKRADLKHIQKRVKRPVARGARARLKALARARTLNTKIQSSSTQARERSKRRAQKRPPSSSAPAEQRVKISSHYKGVKVFLDGSFVGHVYQIDTSRGLMVSLGERHDIRFKSPVCEEYSQTLYFKRALPKPPQVVFECNYLPATFIIRSSADAEVFIAGPNARPIGRTNQVITYPLKSTSTQVRLMLIDASGREERLRPVSLAAGRKREIRWR